MDEKYIAMKANGNNLWKQILSILQEIVYCETILIALKLNV